MYHHSGSVKIFLQYSLYHIHVSPIWNRKCYFAIKKKIFQFIGYFLEVKNYYTIAKLSFSWYRTILDIIIVHCFKHDLWFEAVLDILSSWMVVVSKIFIKQHTSFIWTINVNWVNSLKAMNGIYHKIWQDECLKSITDMVSVKGNQCCSGLTQLLSSKTSSNSLTALAWGN